MTALCTRLRLQMCDAFKVIVLHRQEELVEPPQHGNIRNTSFYNSPGGYRTISDDLEAFYMVIS